MVAAALFYLILSYLVFYLFRNSVTDRTMNVDSE